METMMLDRLETQLSQIAQSESRSVGKLMLTLHTMFPSSCQECAAISRRILRMGMNLRLNLMGSEGTADIENIEAIFAT
jgi:hypothetical protein